MHEERRDLQRLRRRRRRAQLAEDRDDRAAAIPVRVRTVAVRREVLAHLLLDELARRRRVRRPSLERVLGWVDTPFRALELREVIADVREDLDRGGAERRAFDPPGV